MSFTPGLSSRAEAPVPARRRSLSQVQKEKSCDRTGEWGPWGQWAPERVSWCGAAGVRGCRASQWRERDWVARGPQRAVDGPLLRRPQ